MKNLFFSLEAEDLVKEILTIEKNVNYKKIKITGGNKITYHFSDFATFEELFRDHYFKKIKTDDAEMN